MVINRIRNRKSFPANERRQLASTRPLFFPSKGGGGKEIFLEFGVPKYIPYGSLCSHQVLKWLFIMFPTAAHFMLYVFPKGLYK
jgi:hypothetical protein